MRGKLSALLFIPLFVFCAFAVSGEDINYNLHKKYFHLCSFSKECFACESCSKEMYKVKIKNLTDKRIKTIYYQYYSSVYHKNITKEAVIEGDQVEKNDIGILFVCVKNKLHWAISKIVYEDNSEVSFLVDGPLSSYHQEPDECPCNISPKELKY